MLEKRISSSLEQIMGGETPRHVTTKELMQLFGDVFSTTWEDKGLDNQVINGKSFFIYGTRI
jgi:hypothetical protein